MVKDHLSLTKTDISIMNIWKGEYNEKAFFEYVLVCSHVSDNNSGGIMNTILQLHSKVVTSVILITSIVGLLISIYNPLPEYYGTAVSVAIWVFSLWVLKRIRNFYIASKETTTIEKKFDFVAFFVCFPVVTYLAPQISSYQIDGVTSGCFGIQLVWCLKLLYIQFHDPEGNTPE